MKNLARVAEPAVREQRTEGQAQELKPLYMEALTLVERLHRQRIPRPCTR